MSTPQYGESPGRTSASVASSRASSIPMSYSMDSEGASLTQPPNSNIQGVGRESPPGNLPPAYALQHSGHIRGASTSGTSFATTEDSIDSRMDQTIEDSLLSQSTGYEGLGTNSQQRLAQMGSGSPANKGEELNQYYQYQQDQEGYNTLQSDNDQNINLSTVNESYQSSALDTSNNTNEVDATLTIYSMHKKLLQLLSNPQLFNNAISWQEQLDKGIDPSIPMGSSINNIGTNVDSNKLNSGFETEFDDDSTFKGLVDDDTTAAGASTKGGNDKEGETKVAATQDETFEFNPNSNSNTKKEEKEEEEVKPKEEPLPIQIFAHDAEVVLPQALTATQLFGIERITGIELEAAAGVIPLSHLFMRWLALMPEGDHVNVIDPPGLTVMKILGGGYRVTGAHRVVWRWMNKFSPVSTSTGGGQQGGSTDSSDFDFGDLVTMTIIDVFETDVNGKLLSYCPTFDNRAVHKTPETIERIRKGASQLKEGYLNVANSPAGKTASLATRQFGKLSVRAAYVVGNAVKTKIQQQNNVAGDESVEEGLNELLQSQIALDESDVNVNE